MKKAVAFDRACWPRGLVAGIFGPSPPGAPARRPSPFLGHPRRRPLQNPVAQFGYMVACGSPPATVSRMSRSTAPARPLSDSALVLVARRFAALAEPMRLKLVHAL